MEKDEKKKVENVTISLYEFGICDYFLSRSPQRKPFFIKEGKQTIQNFECSVSGEEFQKHLKEYLKILNSGKSKK